MVNYDADAMLKVATREKIVTFLNHLKPKVQITYICGNTSPDFFSLKNLLDSFHYGRELIALLVILHLMYY